MTEKEAKEFESSGVSLESVKIRMWDEAAKETEGVKYPEYSKYRNMMIRVLEKAAEDGGKKGTSPKKAASSPKKADSVSVSPKKTLEGTSASSSPKKASSPSKRKAEDEIHEDVPSPKKQKVSPKKA